MSKVVDLGYTQDSMFITFYPVSEAGGEAWEVMCKQNDGIAIFPAHMLPSIKSQLKQAGYSVRKNAKKLPSASDAELLAELGL